MCSNSTFKILNNVISNLVSQRLPFTAFNASLEAQNQGATELHSQMKDAIHQIMQPYLNNGYSRTMMQIGTQSYQQAWVYYPAGQPTPSVGNLVRTKNSKPKIVASSTTNLNSSPLSNVKVPQTSSRVRIPRNFVEELGGPGQTVYAFNSNGTMLVRSQQPTNHVFETYSIDKRGDLKVNPSRLGLSSKKGNWRVDYNNGSVVLRKV